MLLEIFYTVLLKVVNGKVFKVQCNTRKQSQYRQVWKKGHNIKHVKVGSSCSSQWL